MEQIKMTTRNNTIRKMQNTDWPLPKFMPIIVATPHNMSFVLQ